MNDKKTEIAPAQTPQSLLSWLAIEWPPNFTRSRGLGSLVGAGLTLAIPALFLLALVAAFAVLSKTILDVFTDGGSGPSLGVGAMITALLGVPFVIWGTVIRQKALEFQKEGHITDRISAAVEQLGAEKVVKRTVDIHKGKVGATLQPNEYATKEETVPNIEVRIGGLLSLERIAQDSTRYDQGRDHVRVMEIICAYVRENAPASGAVDFPLADWEPLPDDATEEESETHEMWHKARFGETWTSDAPDAQEWAGSLPAPREDIQTALNILKRRTYEQRKVEANWPDVGPAPEGWVFDEATFKRLPDEPAKDALTKAELEEFEAGLVAWRTRVRTYKGYRLDLRNTNLQRADLSKAMFSGALLYGARMGGAILSGARMEGANLSQARMEGALLFMVRLEGAYLNEARMGGANLGEARMEGANLLMAWMEGANLTRARMEGADLGMAQMAEADLCEVRMEGADLTLARMEGADLSWVHFDENTAFHRADFQAAFWKEVTLLNVHLSQDQINASFGDGSVILPEGLERPAHWPKETVETVEYDEAYENWLSTLSA